MVTGTCWIGKGTILKLVPPLSGLTHLVMATSCTAYGIAKTLFLVPISTYTKLGGVHTWNQERHFGRHVVQVGNFAY